MRYNTHIWRLEGLLLPHSRPPTHQAHSRLRHRSHHSHVPGPLKAGLLQLAVLQPPSVTAEATASYPKLLGSLCHSHSSLPPHNSSPEVSPLAKSGATYPIQDHISFLLTLQHNSPVYL